MPLTPLDYADCNQKKCSTSDGSVIFDCDYPCEYGAVFDYATGTCANDDVAGSWFFSGIQINSGIGYWVFVPEDLS